MILTLQVMTKIIFTPEFQNLTLPSHKILHYKQKIILLLNNQVTTPHRNQFLQKMYNQIYHLSHTVNKLYLFTIHHFLSTKTIFQGFFLSDDYSLDIKTLQQQQSQDPVLRTVYSWLLNNEKPEFITPLITGTPFLHVYYKRFSQLFIDESTNLISLYITNPTVNNQSSTPNFVQDTIRICLPFRLF